MADAVDQAVGNRGRGGRGAGRGGRGRGGRGKGPRGGASTATEERVSTPVEITPPISVNKPVRPGLPKPTMKEANQKSSDGSVTKEDSIFHESVFGAERVLKPARREIAFNPSLTGFTAIVNDAYKAYRNEKRKQVAKEFTPECLRYYSACLFWLRAIGIKSQSGEALTDAEQRVFQALEHKQFNVPEPVFLALKAIGNIKTRTGDYFNATFPELPVAQAGVVPGTLGVIDAANHSIYEEMPVVGVALEALVERVSGADPSRTRPYVSKLAPQRAAATTNLQGYTRLPACRMEAITFINDLGIEDGVYPPGIANSGIIFNVMATISEYLQGTETFKLQTLNPLTLPPTGSIGQIIQSMPQVNELDESSTAANCYVQMQSMTAESAALAGVSEVFGLNQWKVNRNIADNRRLEMSPWSCLLFTADDDIPAGYTEHRNSRRNLPERYYTRVFYAAGDYSGDYRKTVVDRLVHHT